MAVCKDRVSAARRALIEQEASQQGLDPDFLEAVALQENGRDGTQKPDPSNTPNGIAHGWLQVHIGAAKAAGWKGTDPSELNSDANSLHYGAAYLRKSGDQAHCGDDLYCRAAAYNGGPGGTHNPNALHYANSVVEKYNCIKRGEGGNPADKPTPKPSTPADGAGTVVCDTFNPSAETLIPFPMPSNPFFAYFTITVAGFNLTPARPQYVTFFEFTEEMNQRTVCRIKVFDPNWDVISGALDPLANKDFIPDALANCEVSFGYTSRTPEAVNHQRLPGGKSDMWSPPHSLRLLTYHPEFLGWGVEIEVVMEGNELFNGGQRARTLEGPIASGDNENPGICESLILESGFTPCTVPTTAVLDYGVGLDSVAPSDRLWVQDNVDNYVMMQNTMIPMATMDGINGPDGRPNVGAFNLWHETDTGTTHFHPFPTDASHVREYIYARQRYGSVISFKPDINEALVTALAGAGSVGQTFDMTRKRFEEVQVDSVSAPDALFTGPIKRATYEGVTDYGELWRNFPTTQPDIGSLWVEGLNMFQRARLAAMTATLQILGDPLIRPQRSVSVIVLDFHVKSDGTVVPRIHWVSGIWLVQSVTHTIQAGEYLTTLALIRTDVLTGGDLDPSNHDPVPPVDGSTNRFSDTFSNNRVTR